MKKRFEETPRKVANIVPNKSEAPILSCLLIEPEGMSTYYV